MSRMGSSKDIVTRKTNEQNFCDVQNGNNTTARASRVAPKHHQGNVSKISSVSYRPKSLGLQIGNNGTVRTSQVEPKHQRNVSKLSSVPPNSNNNPVSTSLVGPNNQGNVSKISSVSYRQKPSGVYFSNYNTVGTSQVRPKNHVSKVSSVLDKHNPSEVQQHDEKNAVKTSQAELSSDSPTARAKQRIKAYIQTDKTTYTPQHWSTQKSKDFMPPVKNRQRHNTPSSQVWQMKVEIPPSERPSKVTMRPSKNQSGQSHSTPSSHQIWRKKVETHPSERQSKVKMQPSKKQSMVKKQPSKKPSEQQSKQNDPSYHIVWDEFHLQVLMMMMMMMMILSLNHLDKIVLCVMTILHIHPQMKKNYVLLFSQRLLFFHVDIPSIATACCLSHLKSSPRIHHVLFV
nr:uncharacterized protein LOC112024165 isoform X2 [Quercus suber]